MLAVACSSVAAWGADMKLVTKAPEPAPAANPWDFALQLPRHYAIEPQAVGRSLF
jgi:hypothetical protein